MNFSEDFKSEKLPIYQKSLAKYSLWLASFKDSTQVRSYREFNVKKNKFFKFIPNRIFFASKY